MKVSENHMEILEEKVLLWLESARFVKSKPGVYVLYDKKLDALYIGESDNLQKKFEKYVDTNFENDACKQKTHTYQRTFIENPKDRKRELLEDYKKKYGKMPCCNSDID
jgi:excinuclease UvrABC nuclease subunit